MYEKIFSCSSLTKLSTPEFPNKKEGKIKKENIKNACRIDKKL
jgi:hypothetical protein